MARKQDPETLAIETRLAKAGCGQDSATGAVTPPIYPATTFERDEDGGYGREFVYSRWANPTRQLLERTLADLEGGSAAAAFPSGMAGIDTLLRTLSPGDHVVLPDDVYHTTRQSLRVIMDGAGVTFTSVDLSDTVALRSAMKPTTRLVWIETPSNPLCKITDIAEVTQVAHEAGADVVVDNTWMTPLLQRPFEYDVDFVVHSMTKYLSGHSDVLAGAVVARQQTDRFARLMTLQRVGGSVASPFDCWLTLRGMRSLVPRMRLHCENARQLARFLERDARVSRVHYPGLETHALHDVALRQMNDFGGMLSFEAGATEEEALAVAARVRVFVRATSLGGTESLIEHRASIESKPTSTPPGLLRVSVGLESVADLIADLDQALSA